jgi:hypothetical protein
MVEQPKQIIGESALTEKLISDFGGEIIRIDHPQRYRIASGTLVSIKPANDTWKMWQAYTTRTEAIGVRVGGSSGAIVLRVEKWLILTREDQASVLES